MRRNRPSGSKCPYDEQPAAYPSLAVRARNGRVADQPPGTRKELTATHVGANRSNLLHPADSLSIELFLNGDVGHRRGWGGVVPMLLTRREPNQVTRPDFL